MSQRKTITYASAIAAVIACIAVSIWLLGKKAYTNYIPEGAKAVMRIEPSEIPLQADGTSLLLQLFGIKGQGIDFSQALYAFVTPNDLVGFTAALDNAETFSQDVKLSAQDGKASAISRRDDRQWTWLEGGWVLSWSDKDLLILGPGTAQERDVLTQTMRRMTESSKSFDRTDTFDELAEMSGAIRIFATTDALPAPYNLLFKLNQPTTVSPESIHLFASVDFEKTASGNGSFTANCHWTGANENVTKSLCDFEDKLNDIQTAESGDNAFICSLATSISGEHLLKLLRTDVTLRQLLAALNQTIDANRMLGSIDGLLTIDIDSIDAQWNPQFCLKGETHKADLTADADYWLKSIEGQKDVKLVRNSANDFTLTAKGQTLCFGVNAREGVLYFSSHTLKTAAIAPFCVKKSGRSANGLLTAFTLHAQKLYAQPCLQQAEGIAALLQKLLPNTQCITYKAYRGQKATIRVE